MSSWLEQLFDVGLFYFNVCHSVMALRNQQDIFNLNSVPSKSVHIFLKNLHHSLLVLMQEVDSATSYDKSLYVQARANWEINSSNF